jgi:DNA adenine methylase
MSRTVNALLPYYGAKRQMAPRIVEALGPHNSYHELFCGSMAVLFAKPPSRFEAVNDLNGALVNLARVVAHDALAPCLFGRLERTAFCESLYRDSLDWLSGHPDDVRTYPDTDWAYHYFVASWMGRNGLAGTDREGRPAFCVRFTSNGGDPAARWRGAVAQVPAWWERLRNVAVLSRDAFEVLARIEDKPGTTLYVDPPYLEKSAAYRHDFAPEDHDRLAELLRRFKATRCVLSYYDHPRLGELYLRHGWSLERVAVPKNLSVTAGGGPAPEVLLTNHGPATA